MEFEVKFSEHLVEVMGKPVKEWSQLTSWIPLIEGICRTDPAPKGERIFHIFDDIGANFLTEPDGDTIIHMGIYFWVSKKINIVEPKQPFQGTLKLGQYRLRKGITSEAAEFLNELSLGPFKVHLLGGRKLVSLCAISFNQSQKRK